MGVLTPGGSRSTLSSRYASSSEPSHRILANPALASSANFPALLWSRYLGLQAGELALAGGVKAEANIYRSDISHGTESERDERRRSSPPLHHQTFVRSPPPLQAVALLILAP